MVDRFLKGDEACRCGHPRSEHYTYILNGRDQIRCRACDPMVAARRASPDVVNWSLPPSDTHFTAMYYAADHDFENAEAT